MSIEESTVDEERLNELVGTAVNDLGGTFQTALAEIGDRLGLYTALADAGPLNAEELAEQTDTHERYIREWLRSQAAGGYITYDPKTERYSLSPEQTLVLADEDSPAFMLGGFQGTNTIIADVQDDIETAFRTGEGVGWHEHHPELFSATERFYKPSYAASLVDEWIPALGGVDAKLKQGGRVADIGCGHGASTIIMAEAYPNSTFVGVDYHERSIDVARERAEEADVADRIRFEVATAKEYNGSEYDVVTMFDCYHDMGDPIGVAAHVRKTLAEDGTWMLVEPFANDRVEDNLNPVGRVFYGFSTMFCTPNSLDQGADPALGAQAGETRLREVVTEGGFSRFRRAAETPFNLILEAQP
ncbi:methyltransferase type 12 [Halogeometricum pallidum JCM 14848]|uniref:Methyltransferase type 12 n=1 Tax=Halogeometricum pallidum JCM 14848 TaxID=1227487 RepID=M0CW79_HALPD|nr:class I SAM-dependent methyltransferase [Halogeometricum pallidum]ELZ26129.1 methyltransferase type 12 [Halogeometricum pallidum JCM 14848]